MKIKDLSKKLVLNKTTIANLENEEMKNVKGGAWTINYTCYPSCLSVGHLCFDEPKPNIGTEPDSVVFC